MSRTGSNSQSEKKGGEKVSHQKIVVLGVGNILLSDEGVGVCVAQELMKMKLPPGVRVVEGGTEGFGLLDVITEADRLIIVDAVKGGGAPGSIYRFDIEDLSLYPDTCKTSFHQVGIMDVLRLSGLIGKTPQATIIGVEPKSLEMSMTLSCEVSKKVPEVIELVLREIENCTAKQ